MLQTGKQIPSSFYSSNIYWVLTTNLHNKRCSSPYGKQRPLFLYLFKKIISVLWIYIINIAYPLCVSSTLEPEDTAVKRDQSSSFLDFTCYWG